MNPSRTHEATRLSALRAFGLGLFLLGFLPQPRAEQSGLFTYQRVGDAIEIISYPRDAVGHVEIPAVIAGLPVTSVGSQAFIGCTGLTGVTIPEGVKSIGGDAFHGCIALNNVTLPSSLTTILDRAFSGCTGLTHLVIPSGVTHIGREAFYGCTGLTRVTLPASVTKFGWAAFAKCTSLIGITLQQGLATVGDGMFYGCAGLTSVLLEEGLTSIGDSAFQGCTGLTNLVIPSGVTNIGRAAFYACTGLTGINLPSSLTGFGYTAFSGCTGLTAIQVEAGNPSYGSDGGVLLDAAGTELIQYPAGRAGHYAIPSRVAVISDGAFLGSTGLTGVTLPSSLTSIGSWAFSGCTGLTNLVIPSGVTIIDWSAFSGCTRLTSVTLPSSLISLGDEAFSGCTALTAIHVEPGTGAYASEDGVLINAARTQLIRFPEGKAGPYTLPSSITSVGHKPFDGCTSLTAIHVEAGNPAYASDDGVLLNAARTKLIRFPPGKAGAYTLPSTITSIGALDYDEVVTMGGAFSGCTKLTSVTIPASVTRIGWLHSSRGGFHTYPAFSGCTALTRATFLGNAPSMVEGEFADAAPGFTVHHLSSRQGFTSPTWDPYPWGPRPEDLPTIRINEAAYPAAAWLLTHGLGHDTQLNQDPDGDGVSLLTAYALNLDPHLSLQGRLPAPALGAGTLSLSFHASSPGITYRVETSTNLTEWTTAGVTQSAPGPDGRSTASVPRDEPHRFLRLVVED